MYYSARRLVCLAIVGTLAACTSSDNASTTPAGNQDTRLTKTPAAIRYDAFFDGSKLSVVDPSLDIPVAHAIATLSTTDREPLYWSYYNASVTDEGFSDLADKYLLYIDGGRFYRVDLINTTLPAPMTLSSETQADRLCSAAPRRSIHTAVAALRYRLPGSDGICDNGDDTFHRVTLTQGANDAPQSISQQEYLACELFDRQDQLLGSLSLADGGLQWRDTNFANPQPLLPGRLFQQVWVLGASYDRRYALIRLQTVADDGKPVWHLYSFDQQTHNVSQELDNTTNGPEEQASYGYIGSDNGTWYLTRNNQDVIAVPENGGEPATTVIRNGRGLAIVQNRLLLSSLSASNTPKDIYSFLLHESNTAILPIKERVSYYLLSENRLFYTRLNTESEKIEATSGSIRVDGGDDRVIANAVIAGAGASPSQRWSNTRKLTQVFFNLNPTFGGNGTYSGGTLLGYNPISGVQETSIGSVPAGVINYFLFGIDYSGALPAIGHSPDGSTRHMYVVNWHTGKQTLVGSAKNPGDWWNSRARSN